MLAENNLFALFGFEVSLCHWDPNLTRKLESHRRNQGAHKRFCIISNLNVFQCCLEHEIFLRIAVYQKHLFLSKELMSGFAITRKLTFTFTLKEYGMLHSSLSILSPCPSRLL